MYPEFPAEQKSGNKNQHAFIIDEIVFIHQNEGGSGNQADGDRAQTREGS